MLQLPVDADSMRLSAGEDFPCTGRLLLFEVKPAPQPPGPDGAEADVREAWSASMIYVRCAEGRGILLCLVPDSSTTRGTWRCCSSCASALSGQGQQLFECVFIQAVVFKGTVSSLGTFTAASPEVRHVHSGQRGRQTTCVAHRSLQQDPRCDMSTAAVSFRRLLGVGLSLSLRSLLAHLHAQKSAK